MSYVDSAKQQILNPVNEAVKKVANKLADSQPGGSTTQTLTIAHPLELIEQFWRDPEQLSVVFGDIAVVEKSSENRYHWQLLNGPEMTWESRLVAEPGYVRYIGTGDDNRIEVSYRAAPRDLGTEVTLSVKTPVPGLMSGAAVYKVLYRLRAQLQTGEVPTIRSNPSGRSSAR